MAVFYTPQLVISDHYDELVRRIDVHTEQLLEKFSDDDVLDDHWSISEHQLEPFKDISEWDGSVFKWFNYLLNRGMQDLPKLNHQMDLRSTKVKNYIQQCRAEMLEALDKAKQSNLDHYAENKHKIKIHREKMNDPAVKEELRRELFSPHFCFLLDAHTIETFSNQKLVFGLVLVVADFYMSSKQLKILRDNDYMINEGDILHLAFIENSTEQEFVLPSIAGPFIFELISRSHDDIHLVHLRRADIFQPARKYFYVYSFVVDLDRLLQSGKFFAIKELVIEAYGTWSLFEPSNLSALPASLEYMQLNCMEMKDACFPVLPNLVFLELYYCQFSFKDEWFDSFPSLRALRVSECAGMFQLKLKKLSNLTHLSLSIHEESPIDLTESLSDNLQVLELHGQLESFFKTGVPLKHFNLRELRLERERAKLGQFGGACLFGLPNLRKLVVKDFRQVNLDYPFLNKLESLNVKTLGENSHSKGLLKGKSLKNLTLFQDQIKEAKQFPVEMSNLVCLKVTSSESLTSDGPALFSMTRNLEKLCFKCHFRVPLTRETFFGLSKLKELDFSCRPSSFEEGIFSGLVNLESLRFDISSSSAQIPLSLFKGLENLKFLSFKEGNLKFSLSILKLFCPLKNLIILDLTECNLSLLKRSDLVDFFVNKTHINKVVYYTKKFVYRNIEADKIRNEN